MGENEKFLLRIIGEIFPSLSNDLKEEIYNCFSQLSNKNVVSSCNIYQKILQGDIFDDIEFVFYDDSGELTSQIFKGILISHSCDATRKDNVLFAPIRKIDFSLSKSESEEVKKNTVFDKFYLKEIDSVADFSLIQSFPRNFITKFKRVNSLSQFGFYFFIIKLSVFLLRPEQVEEVIREE